MTHNAGKNNGLQVDRKARTEQSWFPMISDTVRKQSRASFSSRSTISLEHPHSGPLEYGISIDNFLNVASVWKDNVSNTRIIQKKQDGQMYTLKRYSKKVMIEKKMISVAMQERFILQKLQCPFITSICYAFQDNHFIYLVTDYADTSFEKVLKSNRVGEGQLRIFAAELVLALQHLHSKFIIYRNLLPETISIKDGHILLNRFEQAVFVNKKPVSNQVGPLERIPPEMYHQKQYKASVDWWQLGLFLFEAIFGQVPQFDFATPEMSRLVFPGKHEHTGVVVPSCSSRESLLLGLLEPIVDRRLGSTKVPNPEEEIKTHSWFAQLDWRKIEKRLVAPVNPMPLPPTKTIRRKSILSLGESLAKMFKSMKKTKIQGEDDDDCSEETLRIEAPSYYIDAINELMCMHYPTYSFENPNEGLMVKPPLED